MAPGKAWGHIALEKPLITFSGRMMRILSVRLFNVCIELFKQVHKHNRVSETISPGSAGGYRFRIRFCLRPSELIQT